MNHRRIIPLGLIALLTLTLLGCAAKTTSTPLPIGATNPTDASSYRVLVDAKAFLGSIGSSVTAGKLTLTATQKTTYNALVTASNTADALWEQYHAATAAQQATLAPQLTTATNNLNAALAAAQGQITVAQ